MELQEIEVTIGKDGQVQLQVRGVSGLQCLTITKELEDALGGEILARIMNPEALDSPTPDVEDDQHLQSHL